jgi:hypothetical protein
VNGIFHLFRQVRNGNSFEGAFANTYSATHTEVLGYQGLAVYKDYSLVSGPDRRAEVLALFGALPGLATIAIDNSYPHSRTSVKKKRPGDQPEVNHYELYIKPIFSMKACRVNLHEGIGDLLYEVSDEDYHDHYKMPGQ